MPNFRTLTIIRDWQDLRGTTPRGPTFVQVPGAWASQVLSLVKLSEEHRHNGLVVTNIGPGSKAATAGILRGDVLLRYDGIEVESVAALRTLTKRPTQSGKSLIIDAARGAEDLKFTVEPGPLGITASPSLHRLKLAAPAPTGALHTKFTAVADLSLPLIQTPEELTKLDPAHPALVEVPAELARTVLAVVKSIESAGKRKKWAKALLTSAQP